MTLTTPLSQVTLLRNTTAASLLVCLAFLPTNAAAQQPHRANCGAGVGWSGPCDPNDPGWRAYCEACGIPCVPGAVPGVTDGPATEIGPDGTPTTPSPDTTPTTPDAGAGAGATPPGGQIPGGLAAAGAFASATSSAPNMIGDLNVGSSTASMIPVDVLRAVTSDLDFSMPAPSAAPMTVFGDGGNQPGPIGIFEAGGGPLGTGALVSLLTSEQIGFTTAISTTDVFASLNTTPGAPIPIINDGAFTYESAVTSEFITRNGAGGTVSFVPTESFAVEQGATPPIIQDSDVDFDVVYSYQYLVAVTIPSPSGSVIVGRVKISDNDSPLPRDRVFYDYNYFHNVPFGGDKLKFSRFAPGFEKTFWDRQASVEVRVPMAIALNSDLMLAPDCSFAGDLSHGEFGNILINTKFLLLDTGELAIAAGLGVALPTADDVSVSRSDGTPLVVVENESVHLLPYVAAFKMLNDTVFVQSFFQLDVDANGNPVNVNTFGPSLTPFGTLNDQTALFFDVALGKWFMRDMQNPRFKGLALVAEAHYSTTLDKMDTVSSNGIVIGDPSQDLDIVNMTIGGHIHYGQSVFTMGYGTPVTNDRLFDGELRLFINRYF